MVLAALKYKLDLHWKQTVAPVDNFISREEKGLGMQRDASLFL